MMTGSCYTCPNDCDKCIGDNKCSSCRDSNYYVHNHTCVKCPVKCLSCTSNTDCIYCTVGFYGKNQCMQDCSTNCQNRECDITGRCKACVDGMYGDNCNIECGQYCTRCYRSTGGCSLCETGTYLYNDQCGRCPPSCTQCTSLMCTECVVGYWGGNCEKICSRCKPGTPCRRSDGLCQQSCVDGMYDRWCNARCSSKCLSCKRLSYPRCTACVENKYDYNTRSRYYNCNANCPQNCLNSTCDDKTGECTFGCTDGYHGKKCKCLQNCNCDNGENCISCKEGFDNVNKNCECTSEKCIDNACSACNSLNYYVHDKTCCSCRGQDTNCEGCTTHENGSFARCTQCKTGFFLPSTQKLCTKCPINCKDSTCDPINGICTLGCRAGHWGTACDNKCTNSCLKCDQHTGTCSVCQRGKYSPNCSKSCSQSCKTIDNVPTCAILDGACIDGCQSTKVHGSHCQHSCSINCSDEQCDWQTAHCVHGCTDHHYGNACKNTCIKTCSTPKTGSRCYDTNGTCVDGCEVGYYGEMCENQCSPNCVDMACEQFTGSCLDGCHGRYEGNDCMMDDVSVTTIVIGVVICLVIAIIVTVGVIFLKAVWKRHNETGETVRNTVHRTENFPNKTDNIDERYVANEGTAYEQVDENPNVQSDKTIDVHNVPPYEDNATVKAEANQFDEYEQIYGGTNLHEAGADEDYLTVVGDNATVKAEANLIDEYEQIDGETNLHEAGADEDYLTVVGDAAHGSGYEPLQPRNSGEISYSGLDVQDEDNVTDETYEDMKTN